MATQSFLKMCMYRGQIKPEDSLGNTNTLKYFQKGFNTTQELQKNALVINVHVQPRAAIHILFQLYFLSIIYDSHTIWNK